MFKRILIANRGEIACRIISTAQRMGVQTVAVYSDVDANALHVKQADQAVCIGGSALADSYLNGLRMIEAAQACGAEAIHPGYGFLSENAEFVDAVVAAGLVFIGPPASAIRSMGLKDAAKVLMEEAGVPVVPGYHGADQSIETLTSQAELTGYPLLIKARAGGGGKGMRRVDNPDEFEQALTSAAREGLASFGDSAVLLERYISKPRHIEIQVFADNFGNVVHLFERDCSLQRRHQKVIEEAPAPDMPEQLREAMTQAAITAARAINYSGAGTIEFIVDGSGPLSVDGFWFMEMNTRLQVEHPVTEAITGKDLVEAQLIVASGQELPFSQNTLQINGHSIEARVYAEDVANDFRPVSGQLQHVAFGAGVRLDTGVESGNYISPFFDPMIAKLIAWDRNRATAISKLRDALQQTHIAGTVTNVEFLTALLEHDGFNKGEVDTGLIERDLPILVQSPAPDYEIQLIAALVLFDIDPLNPMSGWRVFGKESRLVVFKQADKDFSFRLNLRGKHCQLISASSGEEHSLCKLDVVEMTASHVVFTAGQLRKEFRIKCWRDKSVHKVSIAANGNTFEFAKPDPESLGSEEHSSADVLVAPMTGIVTSISTAIGQAVVSGEPLLTMEAMKMESVLSAPRDGIVESIHCASGDNVEDGAVLLRLEEQEES